MDSFSFPPNCFFMYCTIDFCSAKNFSPLESHPLRQICTYKNFSNLLFKVIISCCNYIVNCFSPFETKCRRLQANILPKYIYLPLRDAAQRQRWGSLCRCTQIGVERWLSFSSREYAIQAAIYFALRPPFRDKL